MCGDRNKRCSSDNTLQLTLGTLRCTTEFVSFCSVQTPRSNYHLSQVRKYMSLASPGSPPQRQTSLILLLEKFKSQVNIEKQGNPLGNQTWRRETTTVLHHINHGGSSHVRHLCTCRVACRRARLTLLNTFHYIWFLQKTQAWLPELNSNSEDWKNKILRGKGEVFHLYGLLEDLNKTFL